MIYIFDDDAGKPTLHVKGELHKYLIKVRRHKEGDEISFRSRENVEILHRYKIDVVEPRSAELSLVSSEQREVKSEKSLHVGWCIIDANSIEKVLPSLCEIGVERVSFIACDRSQKNTKLDFKRFQRIMEASMQQCGRSTYIEFDIYKNVGEFIAKFPDLSVFDFCDEILHDYSDVKTVLVGCEGGFSGREKELLSSLKRFRLDTPMVLRSESAVFAIASKIVL